MFYFFHNKAKKGFKNMSRTAKAQILPLNKNKMSNAAVTDLNSIHRTFSEVSRSVLKKQKKETRKMQKTQHA